MVDPYVDGLLKSSIYVEKFTVKGQLVAILNGEVENRKLQLIEAPSRALRRTEIHELILTVDRKASPGAEVDPISYVAFFEVTEPGIVLAGDCIFLAGNHAGSLAGYDETFNANQN